MRRTSGVEDDDEEDDDDEDELELDELSDFFSACLASFLSRRTRRRPRTGGCAWRCRSRCCRSPSP